MCLKKSEIVIDDKEESSDEEDDEDEDEDESDDGSTQMDETESVASVTVVGEDDEKEVDVLDTIEEEKVDTSRFLLELRALDRLNVVSPQDSLRLQATAFMGVAKDATRSPEDVISTPLPGETLAMFYARSRTSSSALLSPGNITPDTGVLAGEYWAGKAYGTSDNRGKMLRRDGFTLAEERYGTSRPFGCLWAHG